MTLCCPDCHEPVVKSNSERGDYWCLECDTSVLERDAMTKLNVWIPCFDDLAQLEKALASTDPFVDDIHVFVVDGRYATFPGDGYLTEGAKAACAEYDHVQYCIPDTSLPIGHADVDDRLRSPQHEQAKWVNYDLLPQWEWAMQMDTDERLQHLSLECIDSLDPEKKYTPNLHNPEGEPLRPGVRLYQPQHWTFWIDDVMFWREFYPRSTPLPSLVEAHLQSAHRNTNYGGVVDCVEILNVGEERPADYQERRADQMETMGADLAARAIRDGVNYPSTVDLKDEYSPEDS